MTNEMQSPLVKEGSALIATSGDNNPTSSSIFIELLGTIFLGTLCIILLITLHQERARYHKLVNTLLEARA